MPRRLILPIILAVALIVTACQSAALPVSVGRLRAAATHSILADLVRNVGGDQIELRTLVGPGRDAHTFEPSPADAVAVSEAALLFENGLEFETWLDDVYTSSGSQAKRVVVSEGIEPRETEEGGAHEGEEEHAEGEEDQHGEHDPHLWPSVANAIQMVRNIRDALASADPANEGLYQSNADAYIAELQTLDAWIFEQVKAVPEERR
ncbi:MAG: zinc ABC transporter substrate-binding protein, partial [Acidobacteria bacterium]|nr:zinc ABC transporter substrate-binding protein [Acidobacteriota bacterium]